MNTIRTGALLSALAASITLAACSSSATTSTGHSNLPSAHTSAAAAKPGGRATAATGGSATGWCAELARAGDALVALGGSATEAPSVYKQKLETLVNDAPADIKPDLQTIAQINEKIVNGDPSAESQISNPAVAAQVEHFASWLQTNCRGIVANLPSGLPSLPSNLGSQLSNALASPTS
jgi:hypothetical protein